MVFNILYDHIYPNVVFFLIYRMYLIYNHSKKEVTMPSTLAYAIVGSVAGSVYYLLKQMNNDLARIGLL